jgi:hypothetical protein
MSQIQAAFQQLFHFMDHCRIISRGLINPIGKTKEKQVRETIIVN